MSARDKKSTTVRSERGPSRLVRAAMGTLEALAPSLATRLAERIFTTPRRRPPREWEQSVFAAAEPVRLEADGVNVRGARIGEGPAVLLVHGWSGGGSQLAAFAPPLLAAGCAVVAFDAPAHGASAGRTATMPEFADAAAVVARRFGARAAIGHSLGAAAVTLALHRGLTLDAAVLVAPTRAAGIFDAFCAAMELRAGTCERLRQRLERRVRASIADLDVRGIAAGLRTPALVIHDSADGDVPFEDGAAIAAAWPGARLLTTDGLGHRRILRDPGVIDQTRSFVLERLPKCGCGRLSTAVAYGEARCETCLLELHLMHREDRGAA